MFSVIIVSAGSSQRYRRSAGHGNKTLELIGGLPVFLHSLLLFRDPRYREIILAVSPDDYRRDTYQSALREYGERICKGDNAIEKVKIIPGGRERFYSVWEGLQHCNSKWVLIHDGARPLLHPEDLSQIEEALKSQHNNAGILPVSLPIDTIKPVNQEGWVTGNLPRHSLRGASTPQGFPLHLLREAYRFRIDAGESKEIPTDDSEIYFAAGYPVLTVLLRHPNPKLTTGEDYEYLKRLWEIREGTVNP